MQGGRIPPRPGRDRPDEAADEERPSRGGHTDQVVRLAVTAAAGDGEDQHAGQIGGNR